MECSRSKQISRSSLMSDRAVRIAARWDCAFSISKYDDLFKTLWFLGETQQRAAYGHVDARCNELCFERERSREQCVDGGGRHVKVALVFGFVLHAAQPLQRA